MPRKFRGHELTPWFRPGGSDRICRTKAALRGLPSRFKQLYTRSPWDRRGQGRDGRDRDGLDCGMFTTIM
jgi:hypothetical protein